MSLRKNADLLFIPESLNFSSSMYCSSSFKWSSLRLVRVLLANSDTSFLKNGYKKTAVKISMFTTVCFNGYSILDRIIQLKLYQIIDKRSRTSEGKCKQINMRVRDTSLRKFVTIMRKAVRDNFSLCTDTGSACYECFGWKIKEVR